MANYEFLNLSAYEFENLSRDLLQAELKITLESFKTGKDGGIDFRYSNGNGNDIVVQCKRYKEYNELLRELKKEAEKVKKIQPKRYIITTSVELSLYQKTIIRELFKGYILNTADIYGKDDLNDLLGLHKDIEKDHFKLWLTSTNILERILHSATYSNMKDEMDKIKEEIKIYVPNKSFNEALSIIEKNRFVIISGIPGIGKSTLARMLCWKFLGENYEDLIPLTGDISEGDSVFQERKKQIFFFDDFLGTNFLEVKLNKNEEARIQKFIMKVRRTKNKILICTTREYILRQAQSEYEVLNIKDIEIGKCIINLDDYNKFEKAKILYNHLYFSSIRKSYLNDLLSNHRYLQIIQHWNYSPRLISSIIDDNKINYGNNFFENFIYNLNNPFMIWETAYINKISMLSRCMLAILALNRPPIFLDDLEKAIEVFSNKYSVKYRFVFNNFEYKKSLKEMENTFIKTAIGDDDKIIIDFQNPSIRDFLINYLECNQSFLQDCIDSSLFLDQMFMALTFCPSKTKKNILEHPSLKKIPVNDKIERIIRRKVIKSFDVLKRSLLIRVYYTNKGEQHMEYAADDIYRKVEMICEFYAEALNPQIEDFISKKIIDTFPENIINIDLMSIKAILEKMENKFPINITELIKVVRENYNDYLGNIDTVIELEKTIEQIFPGRILEDEEYLYNIREVISRELEGCDFDYLKNYYDQYCNINNYYDLDLTSKLDKLQDKIDEAINQEEDDTSTRNIQIDSNTYTNDAYIYQMFDTLLEKE